MSCYDDNPDLSEGTMAYLHGNAAKQKAYEDENARRLSRYDEAVRLLRMSEHARPGSLFFRAYEIKRDEFLADEPQEGRG